MSQENTVYKGSCYCGAVTVTVAGPPAAAGYCHCLECRKWHSAPINAFSIWPDANVTIDGIRVRRMGSPSDGRPVAANRGDEKLCSARLYHKEGLAGDSAAIPGRDAAPQSTTTTRRTCCAPPA